MMFSADCGCENVWASSVHTGFLEKNSKMAGRCWGESTKCATFKIQAVEVANLRVFVVMVKGDAEFKIFHSMLNYNDFFVAQNISENVIAFMGDHPLEERPWIFKIPQGKPWAWPEIKFLRNPIEIQTHFSQEENRHAI